MAEIPKWLEKTKSPFYNVKNLPTKTKKAQKFCGICGRDFKVHRIKKIHKKGLCKIKLGKITITDKYYLIICKFCEEDFFKESELIREQLISFPG